MTEVHTIKPEHPTYCWHFIKCIRFEQTKKGRDEVKMSEPEDKGVLDITAEGKHSSGKVHTNKARLTWEFRKSTALLLPGEELDCRVNFHWISGKADPNPEFPLYGAPQGRIAFHALNETLDRVFIQLQLLTGPRKKKYQNLGRTVKVLPGPGDSREYRVKCLVPSRDNVKTDRMSLRIYINVQDHFRGVEAVYEWKDLNVPADTEPVTLDCNNRMRPVSQSAWHYHYSSDPGQLGSGDTEKVRPAKEPRPGLYGRLSVTH